MKKILSLVLVLVFACMGFAFAEQDEEKVLRIFTWTDYIDSETLAGFTAEYGIEVEFVSFASNEEMLLKLDSNGGSEYDIMHTGSDGHDGLPECDPSGSLSRLDPDCGDAVGAQTRIVCDECIDVLLVDETSCGHVTDEHTVHLGTGHVRIRECLDTRLDTKGPE